MAIDLQLPLAKELSLTGALSVAGFLLWPAAASIVLLRRGAWGLVGFGLLWPWLLYLTEFATVRSQDAFVLYRLYPWIAGPCLVAGVGIVRLARRVAPATISSACAPWRAIDGGRRDARGVQDSAGRTKQRIPIPGE